MMHLHFPNYPSENYIPIFLPSSQTSIPTKYFSCGTSISYRSLYYLFMISLEVCVQSTAMLMIFVFERSWQYKFIHRNYISARVFFKILVLYKWSRENLVFQCFRTRFLYQLFTTYQTITFCSISFTLPFSV